MTHSTSLVDRCFNCFFDQQSGHLFLPGFPLDKGTLSALTKSEPNFLLFPIGQQKVVWIDPTEIQNKWNVPPSLTRGENHVLKQGWKALIQIGQQLCHAPPLSPSWSGEERTKHLIAHAQKQGKFSRFSKGLYGIPATVAVYKKFIAFDEPHSYFAGGSHAALKIARTEQGNEVVRRATTYAGPSAEKIAKLLEERPSLPGILPQFAAGRALTKKGYRWHSYHPLGDIDLFDFMQSDQVMSLSETMDYAHQLLQGGHFLAQWGVHRDIKLENIVLWKKGNQQRIGLTDFDFFVFPDDPLTWKEIICGTKTYISPEKLKRLHKSHKKGSSEQTVRPSCWSEKDDVWAMGNVLFLLFQFPFKERFDLPWGLLKDSHASAIYPAIKKTNILTLILDKEIKFATPLRQLLIGMLVKDPKQRWTFAEALAHFEKNCLPTATENTLSSASSSSLVEKK